MHSDDSIIRQTTRSIFSHWSEMRPEKNDSLYEADDQTVLFDIGTMKDVGWECQKARLKVAFESLEEFRIVPNDDISVVAYADCAWVTCTWWSNGKPKADAAFRLEGRATFVFVKRKGTWLAVHDHVSVPLGA